MDEVQFKVGEVATILGLKHETVLRYIRGRVDEHGHRVDSRFPHAYLPHGAAKFGYRVPESDLRSYAMQQGPWLVARLEQELSKRRANDLASTLQAV